MADTKTYTAADLDAIFGPGAGAHAQALLTSKTAALPQTVAASGKAFYHLYTSEDGRYQRGLHLTSSTPREGVGMPGYPRVKLTIARYPHHPSNTFKLDSSKTVETRDGKPIFLVTHYGKDYEVVEGDPIIYEAPGHEDGAALDEALLAKESA